MSKADNIKQTLEYEGEWPKRAVELLELGRELRAQIGSKSDEKAGKEGDGLLGRLSQIEDELRLLIMEHSLEGIRFNNSVFTVSTQPGRTTVNNEKFMKELLMEGVDMAVIKKALKAATSVGDAFWKKEWKEVKG